MQQLLLGAIVRVGNFWYFFFLATGTLGTIGLYFLLRNRSYRFKYGVLLGILFAGLFLHFLKLAFEPYRSELPASIRKVTFENICAVSTLIFPWIFLWRKNKTLNCYLYFIGVVGGLAAHLYPTNALNQPVQAFDTWRFYINHWGLIAVPVVGAATGVLKVDYKKCWTAPLFFLLIETVILVNEIIVGKLGWIDWVDWDLSYMLDASTRNSSFVFGPDPAYQNVTGFIRIFVPKLFTQDVLGINGGVDFYWPVVWLAIPAFIYLPLFYLILAAPFTRKDMKRDFIALKRKWRALGTDAPENADTDGGADTDGDADTDGGVDTDGDEAAALESGAAESVNLSSTGNGLRTEEPANPLPEPGETPSEPAEERAATDNGN